MHWNGCKRAAIRLQSLEDRVHGRFDCSPLKDRHLDAVTRCASGAEASSLLKKGEVGIDIVLVEVRFCLWSWSMTTRSRGRSGVCEIGLIYKPRACRQWTSTPLLCCVNAVRSSRGILELAGLCEISRGLCAPAGFRILLLRL